MYINIIRNRGRPVGRPRGSGRSRGRPRIHAKSSGDFPGSNISKSLFDDAMLNADDLLEFNKVEYSTSMETTLRLVNTLGTRSLSFHEKKNLQYCKEWTSLFDIRTVIEILEKHRVTIGKW